MIINTLNYKIFKSNMDSCFGSNQFRFVLTTSLVPCGKNTKVTAAVNNRNFVCKIRKQLLWFIKLSLKRDF